MPHLNHAALFKMPTPYVRSVQAAHLRSEVPDAYGPVGAPPDNCAAYHVNTPVEGVSGGGGGGTHMNLKGSAIERRSICRRKSQHTHPPSINPPATHMTELPMFEELS